MSLKLFNNIESTSIKTKNFPLENLLKITIFFSLFAFILIFFAGFFYLGIGSDGGWYSYPAMALGRGGNVAENMNVIENMEQADGVKAIFPFKTYQSIRIFYSFIGLRYLPNTIYTLKIISLFELMVLIILAYILIFRLCKNKLITLLIISVLVNDKAIVLSAASGFRPDNILAGFACLLFLMMLNKKRLSSSIAYIIIACSLMMLVHITAVIPLFFILCFFCLNIILSTSNRLKDLFKVLVVGVIAIVIFYYYEKIFSALLSPDGEIIESGIDIAVKRGIESWYMGLEYIFYKEAYRWKNFFFTSNLGSLLILFFGFMLMIRNKYFFNVRDRIGSAFFGSIILVTIFLAFFDPHIAASHAIPVIPFSFAMLSHEIRLTKLKKNVFIFLILIAFFSSLSSIALATKICISGQGEGYNIITVTRLFKTIFPNDKKKYLVIGPTDIWPFIDENKNVLIYDNTRDRENFDSLKAIINSIDYIIINRDYNNYKWIDTFYKYFPDKHLIKIHKIGDSERFIEVYVIKKNMISKRE